MARRHFKIGMDKNGNKVLKIKCEGMKAFSIQTNGNLPTWHTYPLGFTLEKWTNDGKGAERKRELVSYLQEFGTDRQREAFKNIIEA